MVEPRSSKASVKAWLALSSVVIVVVAGAWVLYTWPPAATPHYPQCVFRSATGLDCPGCGTTRALHELLHGRIGDAFRLNPMLFAIGAVALCALPSLARRRMPEFLSRPWFGWTALAVVAGYWIVRNTPAYPF